MMTDDLTLLREFAVSQSEAAFAQLVERHIGLVYSAAMRRVSNDTHLAEEITQAVFIILARKAQSLGVNTILAAWLYRTTRYAAADTLKQQHRRQQREQEAYMQSLANDNDTSAAWQQIAPVLEAAMDTLAERDRAALLLRFFENKTFAQVATATGGSEDAARVRVNRALEKLRIFFTKRGVTLTAVAIAGTVSANSVQAAPVGLAATVTAMAAKGTLISATLTTLVKGTMKTMTWLKIKFAATLATTVLLAGGAAVVALSAGSNDAAVMTTDATGDLLIIPGQGVGKIRLGMTTNEVITVLGKPERWLGSVMVYDTKLGLGVVQSEAGVKMVSCGGSNLKSPAVRVFKGHTKEGIGMKSSRAEIITAFGAPTAATKMGANVVALLYKPLGVTFTLESETVVGILVTSPSHQR
jgi:RNA polymerase sigma factor (sigma-70 family)